MKNLVKRGFADAAFWRGGAPKSTVDLIQLYAQGVRTIISLETGFADKLGDYPEEQSDWESMGGAYHLVKCSNFWAPTAAQTNEVMRLMGNKPAGKVYLHCFSGVDRTGWMAARYRLSRLDFLNASDAWEVEAKGSGTHWWFYWWGPLFRWRYRNG